MYIFCKSSENQQYAYAKTKAQIDYAVPVQLISAFAFATWIEILSSLKWYQDYSEVYVFSADSLPYEPHHEKT